jgi:hypothetical protein
MHTAHSPLSLGSNFPLPHRTRKPSVVDGSGSYGGAGFPLGKGAVKKYRDSPSLDKEGVRGR